MWWVRNIALGELDLATVDNTWAHAIRAQSVQIGSPAGTLSFRVNSGTAGDTYRVWLGDRLVFSLGDPPPAGSSVDHRENYNTYDPGNRAGPGRTALPDQFSHIQDVPADHPMGSGWRTSDSAGTHDDDLIELTFEPGKPTTYKITPGGSSRDGTDPGKSRMNTPGVATGDPDTPYTYPNVFAYDLPAGFDNRELTLQIETESIGIIYEKGSSSGRSETNDGIPNSGITFTPIEYNTDVEMNANSDSITLDAKGFGTLADAKVRLPVLITPCQTTTVLAIHLDHLRGNPYANDGTISYYGEEKCVVNERLASVGAEMSRIDKALESLERKAITDELTISRIEDADVAQEATNLATASIKTQMSAQVMSKSTRLKDVLIASPLSIFVAQCSVPNFKR